LVKAKLILTAVRLYLTRYESDQEVSCAYKDIHKAKVRFVIFKKNISELIFNSNLYLQVGVGDVKDLKVED